MDLLMEGPLREWLLETHHEANGDRHHQRPSGSECWRPVRRLGNGAYGEVWQENCVSGPSKNAIRAVKCLSKGHARFSEMSKREIEALTTFSDLAVPEYKTCFVQCFGWFFDAVHFYIVMEFLEHGDLQKYITHPFPEPEAASITAQVTKALQYMHQKNFVHRDIKPLNILVSCPGPNWHVKVADFGITKNTDSTGLGTLQIGTNGYMAPELFGDSSDPYTVAIDIWALGAVAFCMRTGSPPFLSVQSLLDYARDQRTQFPTQQLEDSSAFCMSFMLSTMTDAPERRLTIEQVLAHAWLSKQTGVSQRDEPDVDSTNTSTRLGQSPSNDWSNTYSSNTPQQSQIRLADTPMTDPRSESIPSSTPGTSLQSQEPASRELQEKSMVKLPATGIEGHEHEIVAKNGEGSAENQELDYKIQIMGDLVRSYRKEHKYVMAELIGEEIIILRQEALGHKHPDTIRSMAGLAAIYYEQKKYEEAEKIYSQLCNLRRETLGSSHPDTIQTMERLCKIFLQRCKLDEAEEMNVELLCLKRGMLGDKHPDTIQAMSNLALAYYDQKKYDKAVKKLVEVIDLRREVLGDKHPSTIKAFENLLVIYREQKEYDKVAETLVELANLQRGVLGDDHPDTIKAFERLLVLYREQKEYDKVAETLVELANLRRGALGDKHSDTIQAMERVSREYCLQEKYDKAIKTMVEVHDLRREVFGDRHPDTITTLETLGRTYVKQRNWFAANNIRIELHNLRNEAGSSAFAGLLATASRDKSIKIWDPATGESISTLRGTSLRQDLNGLILPGRRPADIGHSSAINIIAWSPCGSWLASASRDKTVKIWQIAPTPRCVSTLTGHKSEVRSIAWSPVGGQLASSSHDCTLKIWDIDTGRCISTLMGHLWKILSTAWSPNGSQLASASRDQEIKIWDVSTGQCILTLPGHVGWIYSIAWSPDGSQLASASGDRTVKIWNVTEERCISTFKGHCDSVRSTAWSSDGSQLASASWDGKLKIWNLTTGQCTLTLPGHGQLKQYSVIWSPDNYHIVSGSTKDVNIWDTGVGMCTLMLEGHTSAVLSMSWSPNARVEPGDTSIGKSID